MNITRLTSILVSLLILMVTSSRQANATDLHTNHDHKNGLHHNYHHTRHHLHSGAIINRDSHLSRLKNRPRVLHDSLKTPKNPEDSEFHRNFLESRAKPHSNNPTSTTTTAKPIATTVRTYPISVNDDRDGIVREQTDKREKLTAVAVAESSGTRAVAYAGYHGDQQFRSRDVFNGFAPITTPQPIYTRHHPGRRVCTRQVPSTVNHRAGTQIRFTYTEVSSFMCCPGWSQVTRTSYGCNRPTCVAPCHNGGVCGTHGKCNCPKGFTGSQCQIDIDECIMEKPCAQICKNLPGSYECHCRYGFQLQPDAQSCRKNDSDGTAFEARDLENDYGITTSTKRPEDEKPHDTENEVGDGDSDKDYETILKRLIKLEKQFARGKRREPETTELTSKVDQAVEGVAELRLAAKNALHFLLETFGPIRQDVYSMKSKFDLEHRRVDYLIQRVAELDHRINGQRPGFING